MSGPTLPYHAHAPSADANHSLYDLIEQLTERLNRQEPIELESVLAKHPAHADELRKIWPSLAILAEMRSVDGKSAPSFPPDGNGHTGSLSGKLGDYRILQEIGRGGMGVVYEAEQISLGRHVALKVLPFAGVLDDRQLQRFKNEALAAAHLNHPHIVDVYGVGCERGVHFYTMRLINGVSMQQVIAELRETPAGPTPARSASKGSDAIPAPAADTPHLAALSTDPARRKEYFRQIAQLGIDAAEALHHAHEQGVVHRDIKPSNLMLDQRGKLWVTDFGLAQIETGATLTMSGELIGTLRYMSPEQAAGQRLGLDHRCDVYSLGATLYELLTLQPAFAGENRAELLQQILFHDPQPLRKVRPEIPVDLETIIAKAMAKSASDRYRSAQEMAEDLRRVMSDRPILSRRVTSWGKLRRWARRNPVVATLLALFVTTLIAGTTVSTVLATRANQALEDMRDAEDDYRLEHERAQENLYNAADTVQKLLTRVSQEQLFYTPGATEIRRQLLIEAGAQLDALSEGQEDPRLLSLTALAYRNIGAIHYQRGDYPEAETALARALSIHVALASVDSTDQAQVEIAVDRWLIAIVLSAVQRNSDADSHLTQAIDSVTDICSRLPDQMEYRGSLYHLHEVRGLVRANMGNVIEGETDLRKALNLARSLIEARVGGERGVAANGMATIRTVVFLSNVLRTQGDISSAAALVEEGSLLIDEIELVVADLGESFNDIGAVVPYPPHLNLAWSKAELLIERGEVFLARNDESSAFMSFREAIALLTPIVRDFPEIYWGPTWMGKAYAGLSETSDEDELDRCVTAVAELIELVPNKSSKAEVCGRVVRNCVEDGSRNQQPEVLRLAQIAVQCSPTVDTWNLLGIALFRTGKHQEAIDALMESDAIEVEKTGCNALFLAMSYWHLGDTESATDWFQRGIDTMDSHDSNPGELLRFRAEADALLGVAAEPAM